MVTQGCSAIMRKRSGLEWRSSFAALRRPMALVLCPTLFVQEGQTFSEII